MRVHRIDEGLLCRCGHRWGEHRHLDVRNPRSMGHPLVIGGSIAGECQHGPAIAKYFNDTDQLCRCDGFRPKARNVKRLVDAWRKANG